MECDKNSFNIVISSAVASSMSIHHLVLRNQPSLPRRFISNQQEVEVIWTHAPQNDQENKNGKILLQAEVFGFGHDDDGDFFLLF